MQVSVLNATVEYHEVFVVIEPTTRRVLLQAVDSMRPVGFETYEEARDAATEVGMTHFAIDKRFTTAREWFNYYITHESYEEGRAKIAAPAPEPGDILSRLRDNQTSAIGPRYNLFRPNGGY